MKPAFRVLSTLVASASVAYLAAACVDAPRPSPIALIPSAAPSPSSAQAPAPTATATANAKVAPPEPPAAWNDPAIVAELAKDCHWKPADDAPTAPAFSCTVELEQSCNRSECDDVLDTCVDGCAKVCGKCGDQCLTTCDSCKTSCHDDACKAQCAKTTGDCRQACVGTKDRCGSGECAKADATCEDKFHKDWTASQCDKLVPKFNACVEKCPAAAGDFSVVWNCQQGCVRSVMHPRGKTDCARFFPFYRVF